MSLEDNKALVRRYFEDAPYNPGACDEIFAPKFRFHAIHHATVNADVESSPEIEKEAYRQLESVWGGWHVTIKEMIAEGDRVMVRWTSHGTHQGEYFGLPATGRPVTHSGINIFRVEDGKIAEVWDLIDRLWQWQQLGVLPGIPEAIARTRAAMLAGARKQIVEALENGWGTYVERFRRLAPKAQAAFLAQQGYARFADILAHVIAWWEAGQHDVERMLADPSFDSPDYAVDAFNAAAVERFSHLDEPAVAESFEATRQALLGLVARLPDDAFCDKRIAGRLNIEVTGHLREHDIPTR